jgi:hypothetical protein
MALSALPVWILLRALFSQSHKDEDERSAWSFDDEGFGLLAAGAQSGKVLYSEVREVEVRQGWLQRLYGLGSVRVSWRPRGPSSFGKYREESLLRFVDIPLVEAPQRLAEWLLARTREAREKQQGGANGG